MYAYDTTDAWTEMFGIDAMQDATCKYCGTWSEDVLFFGFCPNC